MNIDSHGSVRSEGVRDSRRQLEAICNNATVALFIMDHRQHCTYMNPAAERLTGYTVAEVQGRPLHDVIHHTRPDGSHYPLEECPIDRAFPEQNQMQGEDVFVHKDGSFYPVAFTASPIREGGETVGTIIEVQDISARKAVEERLRRSEERYRLLAEAAEDARAQAEAANRLKDEFLTTLSHELRTPLNAIIGWTKILRGENIDDEDRAQGLEVIERNGQAQAQLIEDLLDISRIISGKLTLDLQRLNLIEVIEAAADAVVPMANAKGVRIEKIFDSLAGPISGDPTRLQQVIWNLLTNGVKFTPKGGKVQVLLERVNSHVEVSVIDTGIGIKPDFLPHVFDRFRQGDGTTTRRHGGLGLGLSIVKQLVEMHGGSVRVKSPGEGQGATFVVALPITVVHPEQPEKVRLKSTHDGAEVMCDSRDLQGIKVVVVDDEPDARMLIQKVLGARGASVATAASADQALAPVEEFKPDILISDVGMPEKDGYDLIRQLRRRLTMRDLPAIALSAFARTEDRTRSLRSGFQVHLAKPMDPEELVALVASLVGRSG